MNIATLIKLSDSEKQILKRVTVASVLACIAVVAVTWGVQWLRIQSRVTKKRMEDISQLYRKKSSDLMEVDIAAHRLAIRQYMDSETPAHAIEHILRILPRFGDDHRLRCDLGTAYLQAGRYDKARAVFKKLLEQDIGDSLSPIAAARYGMALFYTGDINESITRLTHCLHSFPASAEAACDLGLIAASVKPNTEKADEYFQRALGIDSGYVDAWYERARFAMKKERYHRARRYLLRVLRLQPLHSKAHARLGMVYYYLNLHDLAKTEYQTALALNGDDYNTRYNLGELYFSVYRDSKKALEQFREALERNPAHTRANFKSGLICLETGMAKEAAVFFERARKTDPENIRILLQLAVTYEQLDMKQKAAETYRSVLAINALNEVALQKLKLLAKG